MILEYKTRGNSSPKGKSRVFFASHPYDFDSYFSKLSNEILERQNCAIWYLADFNDIDEISLKNDLALMQLIIVPITENLLTQDSYVSKMVLPYSLENHIPVCPIVYEDNLASLLSQDGQIKQSYNKMFGDIQYLDKFTKDSTEIPYYEKLTSYLSKILVGDELAIKIRSAFDAYIFMSYRKKDREYAQKLMHLIHKNEFCKNIAIWYDEFLVPGEKFNSAIADVLQKSDLFALVVTPNLINESNYVMTTEYPMAKESNKTILAAEMVETDKENLKIKFDGLPECVDASKSNELSSALQSIVYNIALRQNEGTPEHKFFIGLAYLNGIDVEVNYEIGISSIKEAAKEGLVEAMEKLASIYRFGVGVSCDYDEASYWQSCLVEAYKTEYEKTHSEKSTELFGNALWELGNIYEECNLLNNAINAYQKSEELYQNAGRDFYGKKIRVLYSIANLYAKTDDFESQNNAFLYYKKIIALLEETANNKLNDSELFEIANFYDMLAMFLINISRRFDEKIDTKDLSLSSRRLRRAIEKNNKIDFETTLKNSIFHYRTAFQNDMFLKESGISSIVESLGGKVDSESDFTYGNPLMEAEELLFLSLSIVEYLFEGDLEKYRKNYSTVFCHIADLWMILGYAEKAIETYDVNIKILKKFSHEYFQNLDVEIASSHLQLGKAFIGIRNFNNAKVHFEKAISYLEQYQENSLQISIILADAYQQMAMISNNDKLNMHFLMKTKDVLEKIVETKFSTMKLTIQLANCYCAIAENCVEFDSRDSELFFIMFEKIHKIIDKYYDKDKVSCSILLNKIYLLRTLMEDYKTLKSVDFLVECIKAAIENCKTLTIEDSEFNYGSWIQTVNRIKSFNYYATNSFNEQWLAHWKNDLAYIIAENLNFIIDFANNNARKLLPHNFRSDFSDYDLSCGKVNFKFIREYKTILYIFFELLIKNAYNEGLLDKSFDVKQLIADIYDELIKNQKQGYAFQIFNKEKQELISLFN